MAQPIWITPAGNLGSIPSGTFYEIPLEAYEPETGAQVYFDVIAGDLPPGVECNTDGLISGTPATIQGVPFPVPYDTVSKFAVRAYTKRLVENSFVINRLADQTFTITVTSHQTPRFITPQGLVAQFYDGTMVTTELQDGIKVNGLQILYAGIDDPDTTTVKLLSGKLPLGTTISPTGLITGFIQPSIPIDQVPGFSRDNQGFSEYSFDFSPQSQSATYQFTLEVTDGNVSDVRSFYIEVYSKSDMRADTTQASADNTFITADVTPVTPPVILTPQGIIGTTRNDNYFAFHFDAISIDGDPIKYELSVGSGVGFDNVPYDEVGTTFDQGSSELPPGLTLDENSGWLYGYIPNLGLVESTYNFAIRVYNAFIPTNISDFYYYSLIVNGDINTKVIWLTPSYLGTIDNGAVSTLYVKAESVEGIQLYYRLADGLFNHLPQALELLPNGDIIGRVSFNIFAIDNGYTTFDHDTTTFDLICRFTVNAYSQSEYINVFKEFTIRLVRKYNEPYENIYIQGLLPLDQRKLITNFVTNTDIFVPDLIYRAEDPNFGVSTQVIYWHAYGLTSATLEDYYSSLYLNHYWKQLILGELKTARALDDQGNVLYEVIYSSIVDDLVNNEDVSVGKEVVLPYPVEWQYDPTVFDNGLTYFDTRKTTFFGNDTQTVFPNSLPNMRTQVIDTVGQVSHILPRWMLSTQENGRVLGFTPAWVIAYTKPGESDRILYNIQQSSYFNELNKIDFKVDRYELDRTLSIHWDPITKSWTPPGSQTTFDRYQRPNNLVFLGNVDYGTNQAYININHRTINYINSIGGIDGIINENINGKTLIFVEQENYNSPINSYTPGYLTPDQAWTDNFPFDSVTRTVPNCVSEQVGFDYWSYDSTPYDYSEAIIVSGEPDPLDGLPGTFDSIGFDYGVVVPGQSAPEASENLRMGIWKIHVDSENIVTLELIETTTTYDYVQVRGGASYNMTALYVPSVPAPGLLLINWQPLPTIDAGETTFDMNSLLFIDPVDMYTSSNEYDAYLVFPHRNILG